MAFKDNRSNRKIDEFFSPTAPGASHVGNNLNAESTAVSNEVEMRGVAEVTERTNVPLDSTQSQSLLELDLPSYPDIENLTEDDLKKDEVRIKLLQGTWDHCHKFKFPSKGIECFHSRDYRPYLFTETKESICIKIEFNSQRFSLEHQHGRRDVM